MTETGKIAVEFLLEGLNFDTAGAASSAIKRKLQQLGVKAEIIRNVAISAYEAEINVIIHAHNGLIKAYIFPDRTEILIEDQGPGIPDIDLAMQEGFSTATDEIRAIGFGAGMGLPNMLRCSDDFAISSEVGVGTKIKMVFQH
ncbi:MAG: anti-sigma regulatory factor [Sporomusaceae bacterium]|jgi:anti-sigma regulatory factor (Ser/Thr protein kinase)|nr:anti-sigma regulatory factor [Sporomusaceae bacterium]